MFVVCDLRLTFEFGHVHAKGVALFEHALAAAFDEFVEAVGEGGHALAQVVETEVDGGEAVGHRGRICVVWCLQGAREGRAEAVGGCWYGGHDFEQLQYVARVCSRSDMQ
jgi:hypothetical protein